MNKTLQYALFAAGGVALFAGTFVGVASLSGVPMHEVAVIGGLFSAPEPTPVSPELEALAEREPQLSGREALERQAGLLGAFMVESPFTGTELHKLQDELKGKFQENRLLSERLRVRELELEEWEKTLGEKYNELADMRTKLEEMESSIALRYAELERDEAAKRGRELAGWKAQAALYAGGKPETSAKMLAEEAPADAAIILRELGADQAGEILRLVQPLSLRKQIMDAYRKASEAP